MSIPTEAREIYLNEHGEPIAYCPKDSIGITDIERVQFYELNRTRCAELKERAVAKGGGFIVVCIDVDDQTWTFMVDSLMPGHDWNAYRQRGERPVARGVVPRELIVPLIEKAYPAALPVPEAEFIAVFAAGGVMATIE